MAYQAQLLLQALVSRQRSYRCQITPRMRLATVQAFFTPFSFPESLSLGHVVGETSCHCAMSLKKNAWPWERGCCHRNSTILNRSRNHLELSSAVFYLVLFSCPLLYLSHFLHVGGEDLGLLITTTKAEMLRLFQTLRVANNPLLVLILTESGLGVFLLPPGWDASPSQGKLEQ